MSVAATGLWRMGAVELAEVIRSRQASSREVIEAHLRRIEAVNPSINAVAITHSPAIDASSTASIASPAVTRAMIPVTSASAPTADARTM